ncbi:GSCFA family protein [Mariniphaga anaerophila]|uniref:GSCFA family protein n=1 Tax=Mariniphaga anaerophila TaxID=1484053 RepID=A0A1M4YNB8_9BACT|nr:GSCFA domain-containing protein [Mariniphaga anaerophila]SHF07280.1 GSCFA family protein [Mariniphaga anaerophila]
MKFQTEIELPQFCWKTGYRKRNLFMGSCFTENVGNKMAGLKYPVDINPFGILYNPVSVANGLRFLLEKKKFAKNDLIQNNGLWHSFFHHSRFSSPDAEETLDAINNRIESSAEFLKNAGFLFLTFGTAWVYAYNKTGQTVSNCHKIPEKEFRRFRLTPDEITENYKQLFSEIRQINPEIKLIFTVSPIRHWKDGAIENQRSKSTLLLAIDQLVNELGKENCDYFPAYEIVMDELRDYRFYADDMIHLSNSAINHIWEKFQMALIDEESRNISKKVKNLITAVNHKPFNRQTKEHQQFLTESLQKTQDIQNRFPYLNLASEQDYFLTQLTEIKNIQFKL